METHEQKKPEEKSPKEDEEEEKGKYVRGVKPKELDEEEEFQLKIPKAQVLMVLSMNFFFEMFLNLVSYSTSLRNFI